MAPSLRLTALTLSVLVIHVSCFATARGQTRSDNDGDDLVHISCVHASYPDICVRTLSTYPDPPKTPREMAQAAVEVSLAHAHKLSNFLAEQKESRKRQKTALKDCLEQLGDSMDELQRTLGELKHLRPGSFRWQMSNVQTWVSAALTNDETCLDGVMTAGELKDQVSKRIVGVAKVTSNALYLIAQLDAKHG